MKDSDDLKENRAKKKKNKNGDIKSYFLAVRL